MNEANDVLDNAFLPSKDFMTPVDSPANSSNLKKTTLSKISLVFALLGLVTPIFVIGFARLIMGLPCCGEEHNPADGIGWLLVMSAGIAWWTLVEILSLLFLVIGAALQESGRPRTFAKVSSFLSLVLISLIYILAYWLVSNAGRAR